jgi:AraC-like DNA-binding protein
MCRITRFAGIISQLKTNRECDWGDMSLDSGFSDQAHLIRDWKYFTGSSPLSYLNNLSSFEAAVIGLF